MSNAARDVRPTETAVRGVQRALDVANSVSRQLMVTGGPLSSRPATRSLFSRFEVISVDGARAASLALGGSRNDLLVATAASGLGRYHGELGQPSAELRLATPTSQRRGRRGGRQLVRSCPPRGSDLGGAARAHSSVSSSSGWRRPGGSRRCRSPPRWRPRSGACPPACSSRPSTPKPTPSTSPRPPCPGLRGARHICGSLIDDDLSARPAAGLPDEHHRVRQR